MLNPLERLNTMNNPTIGRYPATRLRRLRSTSWSRNLARETTLTPHDLILPLFVLPDAGVATEAIESLPNVYRYSIEALLPVCQQAIDLGIPMVALFPCTPTELKTPDAVEAFNPESLACQAIRAIKAQFGDNLGVMIDVALDLYTSHGHDGLLSADGQRVLNDETVEALVKQSLNYARAGVDAIGPSDMMDGRIGAIRAAFEAEGFVDTQIVAYSAKFASGLYGPYRSAVGSASQLGGASKASYQQDAGNSKEALHEALLDVAEGADVVMVKPASYYMDVIAKVEEACLVPVWAYQVSGEYAMIMAAGERGWVDAERVLLEALVCLKRAGCSGILTYGALQVAKNLRG